MRLIPRKLSIYRGIDLQCTFQWGVTQKYCNFVSFHNLKLNISIIILLNMQDLFILDIYISIKQAIITQLRLVLVYTVNDTKYQ